MKKIELMHMIFGTDDGKICADCSNFCRVRYNRRNIGKCTVYGVSSSAATDWSGRYTACGAFNRTIKKSGEIRHLVPKYTGKSKNKKPDICEGQTEMEEFL